MTPKKAQISPKKNEKVGPNLGPKTGTRNWSPGALAIKFLKEGQILDQFLVQFPGPKIGPRNRRKIEKSANVGFNFGPQRGALKHIFSNPTISLVCPASLTDPSAGS